MEVVSPISVEPSFASSVASASKPSDINNNPSSNLPMKDSSATAEGVMEEVKVEQPENSAVSSTDGAGMDVSHHDETIRATPSTAATTANPNLSTKELPATVSSPTSMATSTLPATAAPTTTTTTTTSNDSPSAFKPFDVSQIMNAPPMGGAPSTTSPSVVVNSTHGMLPASMLNSLPFHMQQHIQSSLSPSLPSDSSSGMAQHQQQQQQSQSLHQTQQGQTFLPSSVLLGSSPSSNTSASSTSLTDPNNPNQGALVRSTSFEKGTKYIDLTDYLALPQTEAARRLGIPTSTLSKRWKEAVVNRKWPYRMVCKLNKEIMTLLHNVPQGPGAPPLPAEIEQSLGILLRRRQEELRGVVIRV